MKGGPRRANDIDARFSEDGREGWRLASSFETAEPSACTVSWQRWATQRCPRTRTKAERIERAWEQAEPQDAGMLRVIGV